MKDLTPLEKYRLREKERQLYGCNGDSSNGIFKVFVNGKSFFCIVSNGGSWEHISVSMPNQKRCPTWEEMCAIKDMFFEAEEVVVQYHPKKSEYVNNHPCCLHLWKPINKEMPTPPKLFVGV